MLKLNLISKLFSNKLKGIILQEEKFWFCSTRAEHTRKYNNKVLMFKSMLKNRQMEVEYFIWILDRCNFALSWNYRRSFQVMETILELYFLSTIWVKIFNLQNYPTELIIWSEWKMKSLYLKITLKIDK